MVIDLKSGELREEIAGVDDKLEALDPVIESLVKMYYAYASRLEYCKNKKWFRSEKQIAKAQKKVDDCLSSLRSAVADKFPSEDVSVLMGISLKDDGTVVCDVAPQVLEGATM